MSASFILVLESGPGMGTRIPVTTGLTIGRQADNVLALDDDRLSRHHARVDLLDDLTIADLGSVNGTTVNGHRVVGSCALHPGDRVQVGATILRVEALPAEPTPVAATLGSQTVPGPSPVGMSSPAAVPAATDVSSGSRIGARSRSRLPLVLGGIVGVLLLVCGCGGVSLALLLQAGSGTPSGSDTRRAGSSGPTATVSPTAGSSRTGGQASPTAASGGQASPTSVKGGQASPTAASSGRTGGGGQAVSPATGPYECYAFSGGRLVPRGGLNFSITGPGRYSDVNGAAGTYVYDVGSRILTFRNGALDGQRAQYDENPKPSTITFLNARGERGDACDNQS